MSSSRSPAAIRRGFCRRRDCPGRAAYAAWYQDDTGEQGEPGGEVTEAHRSLSRLIAKLVCHYSALFGTEVDMDTALELNAIDRAARPARVTPPRAATAS